MAMNTYHAFGKAPSDDDDERRVKECSLDSCSEDMCQRKIHLWELAHTGKWGTKRIAYLVVVCLVDGCQMLGELFDQGYKNL